MSKVTLEVVDFPIPFDHLNCSTKGVPRIDRWDIARALVTLATQRSGALRLIRKYGLSSFLGHYQFEPYLFAWSHCRSSPRALEISPLFFDLGATEKGPISRKLGEAFAKLYAERVLAVPKLIVLESIISAGGARVTYVDPGSALPKEPDMVGLSRSREWHVVEAKGSSSFAARNSIWRHGKEQARNISTINGAVPATRSVCTTFLDRGPFHSILRDPPSDAQETAEIEIRNLDSHYYVPFLASDGDRPVSRRTIGTESFEVVPIQAGDERLEYGIAARVLDRLRAGEPVSDGDVEIFANISANGSDEYSVGLDGLMVRPRQ